MSKIIHIVFSKSAEGSFKYAVNIKKSIAGNKIIALYDNLSVGRLGDLNKLDDRKKWWGQINEDHIDICENIDVIEENYDKFYKDISEISETDIVYLWYGKCDEETCGMLYTMNLLKDKLVNVYNVNVSNIFIKKKDGVVFVRSAGEIVPQELGNYMSKAEKLGSEEYKNLIKQWERLVKENSILRTYKNNKIHSVNEDYFDKDILEFCNREYNKVLRIMGNVLVNSESRITEEYILWRIKKLVKSGKLKLKGDFVVMKELEVCITGGGLDYSNSKFKIKLAEKNNSNSILQLLNTVTLNLHNRGINQWEYPWKFDEIQLEIKEGHTYIVTIDDEIIGVFSVKDVGSSDGIDFIKWSSMYLYRIAILPQYQGNNIGYEIIKYAHTLAGNSNKTLYLDCWAGNEKLKKFYINTGFCYCGDFPEEDYMISVFKYE